MPRRLGLSRRNQRRDRCVQGAVTSPRQRALGYGVIAEILLAAMLIVWSSGTDTTQTAPFGLALSRVVVVASMITLALAILRVARRLPPVVTGVIVVLAVLLNGAVGAMAIGLLITDPGLAFTLGLGCLLAYAVAWRIAALEIRRN